MKMKQKLVRCYRGFGTVPGKWNVEVFYTMCSLKLFTCIECGEIFIIDFENPRFAGMKAEQIAGDAKCSKCERLLRETIRPYPESFRTDEGLVGHFDPMSEIPLDSESLVKEFIQIW
jgi:hypothetical protein